MKAPGEVGKAAKRRWESLFVTCLYSSRMAVLADFHSFRIAAPIIIQSWAEVLMERELALLDFRSP